MCHFDHDCGHDTCHECHTVMQLRMLPYIKESNAAHVAYALVPSILCTRQQQCMMQLMPCAVQCMCHEPVPYCVMLNAVLHSMSHVSSAALSCRLLPCAAHWLVQPLQPGGGWRCTPRQHEAAPSQPRPASLRLLSSRGGLDNYKVSSETAAAAPVLHCPAPWRDDS